jgi:hypothetical protein
MPASAPATTKPRRVGLWLLSCLAAVSGLGLTDAALPDAAAAGGPQPPSATQPTEGAPTGAISEFHQLIQQRELRLIEQHELLQNAARQQAGGRRPSLEVRRRLWELQKLLDLNEDRLAKLAITYGWEIPPRPEFQAVSEEVDVSYTPPSPTPPAQPKPTQAKPTQAESTQPGRAQPDLEREVRRATGRVSTPSPATADQRRRRAQRFLAKLNFSGFVASRLSQVTGD